VHTAGKKFCTVDLGSTKLGTLRTCARVPRARARGARETNPPAFTTIFFYFKVSRPVLQKYCIVHCSTAVPVPPVLLLCSTTCITSAPRTRKMPRRSPACPTAAEARGRRPEAGRRRAWGSRGHFGGCCCCLTAGATTDHSLDASRLWHPGTRTSNKVQ
jgi:hypothetical protein